jgi:lycopene beta-cyclase
MLPKRDKYDYIIAGAGCAGLSLAMHMIHSGQFGNKRILLVDKKEKKKNDRTWCFWETTPGLFESIIYKKWEKAWFHSDPVSRLLQLSPYQYKLIRGLDFYDYCLECIRQHPHFEMQSGDIKEMKSEGNQSWVETDGGKIFADFIFNSILFDKPALKKKEYYLLQHFKGWLIETEKPAFQADEATLMDFRVDQQRGTTFVYVMPFNATKALIEYTLFSESLLMPEQYDEGLKEYIRNFLSIGSYKIEEEESGVIPMTNRRFPAHQNNIIHIGTAGGQTKASSGYTFRFIQKHSAALVEQLVKTGKPFIPSGAKRFSFYDSVLLNILHNKKLAGDKIFTGLFKKNSPKDVLQFLDNESSLLGELKIISSLPTLAFLKAALQQL